MKDDVFISHASEDKLDIALPLASRLNDHNVKVWLDKSELSLGDSLRRKIDQGLSQSRFGVVILSPNFFKKEWPKKELDALVSREDGKAKIILPIIHNITHKEIRKFSPLLADKVAVSSEKGIDIIAQEILHVLFGDKPFKRIVIGISGASCSGKTWFAKKIEQIRPNSVCIFDLDSYYKEINYVSTLENKHDNPNAINFDDALIDLALLKKGQEVTIPKYDFESHTKVGFKTCKPAQIIIVEGLFVFYNKRLLQEMDIKVWLDTEEDLRYERRISRDVEERGRSVKEVISRYANDVQPGYQKYIHPLRRFADMVFLNNLRDKERLPLLLNMLLSYADAVSFNYPVKSK